MAGNELHSNLDEDEDLILDQMEETQRQLEQKVQLGIRRREAWELKFHEQIAGILDSLQFLLNTHETSQSQATPKSTHPLPTPQQPTSAYPPTPQPQPQFSHTSSQTTNTEIKNEIPNSNTPSDIPNTSSLRLHENSDKEQPEVWYAHNLLDERLLVPKSVRVNPKGSELDVEAEEPEVESINMNPIGGLKVDDVVVIREFVKDRGKREANILTNFVLQDFMVEPTARKLESVMEELDKGISEQDNGQMEPISENSFRGLEIDDVAMIREFVKDRGKQLESIVEELGIEPNLVTDELEDQNSEEQEKFVKTRGPDCYQVIGAVNFLPGLRLGPDISFTYRGRIATCALLLAWCRRLASERIFLELARRNNECGESWSRRNDKPRPWSEVIRIKTDMTEELILEKRLNDEQFVRPPRFEKDRGRQEESRDKCHAINSCQFLLLCSLGQIAGPVSAAKKLKEYLLHGSNVTMATSTMGLENHIRMMTFVKDRGKRTMNRQGIDIDTRRTEGWFCLFAKQYNERAVTWPQEITRIETNEITRIKTRFVHDRGRQTTNRGNEAMKETQTKNGSKWTEVWCSLILSKLQHGAGSNVESINFNFCREHKEAWFRLIEKGRRWPEFARAPLRIMLNRRVGAHSESLLHRPSIEKLCPRKNNGERWVSRSRRIVEGQTRVVKIWGHGYGTVIFLAELRPAIHLSNNGMVMKLDGGQEEPWPRRIEHWPKLGRIQQRPEQTWPDFAWKNESCRISRQADGRTEAWSRRPPKPDGRNSRGDRASNRKSRRIANDGGQNRSLKLMMFLIWVLKGMRKRRSGGGRSIWNQRISNDCGRWISCDFLWCEILVTYEEDNGFRKMANWVVCLVDNMWAAMLGWTECLIWGNI